MNQNQHPFTLQQLFNLKMTTLERRLTQLYMEENDPDQLVQFVYILQIRQRLVAHPVECPCHNLIREIFQTRRIRRKLKRYFYFFQAYFTKEEWAVLTKRWLNNVKRCIRNALKETKRVGRRLFLRWGNDYRDPFRTSKTRKIVIYQNGRFDSLILRLRSRNEF